MEIPLSKAMTELTVFDKLACCPISVYRPIEDEYIIFTQGVAVLVQYKNDNLFLRIFFVVQMKCEDKWNFTLF